MFGAIIGPIFNLLGTIASGYIDRAKAKTEQKVAESKSRATIAEKIACGDIEWDAKMAGASATSWKDEYLTLLVSVPAIMAFIGYQDQVTKGFAALNTMPPWYQYAIGIVFAASFGLKAAATMMFNQKG